jgi:tetracycline resistance efflux pump
MKRIRLAIGSIFVLLFIFLLFYGGDNEYLQEKTADKIWFEYTNTINELVRKGDHIVYNNIVPPTENGRWKKYRDRFAYQVEYLNIKNAPIMRNSYELDTKFEDMDGKYNISFTIYEKNTGQVMDTREISSEPIKAKSIIPALLALAFAIITLKPVLSIFIAIWVGSTINNANSPIVGLQQMIANYIPAGIIGNDLSSLKIIISFLLIQISLTMLYYSSCARNLKDSDSKFLKIFPLPFMAVHPYIFSSIGAWWMGLFTAKPKKIYRTSFISHSLGLALPALLLSPYVLYVLAIVGRQLSTMNVQQTPVELFINTLPFRFFSFSMIAVIIGYMIFNKEIGLISSDAAQVPFFNRFKTMMRPNRWLPTAAVFTCIAALTTGFFYFDDINTSLLVGASAFFLVTLTVLLKSYLLSITEAAKTFWYSFRDNLRYIVLLVLTFALAKVLTDLGTVYYVISLFKVSIGSSIFPLAAFVISVITTIFMGNSLVTFSFLIPLLLPIAGQLGGAAGLMMTAAGILEGGIAGEMLTPFSPTSIIISSIYKISPVKHVIAQAPYTSMALACTAILGFLMAGTDMPIWVSYCAILAFGLIVMFKKPIHIK